MIIGVYVKKNETKNEESKKRRKKDKNSKYI